MSRGNGNRWFVVWVLMIGCVALAMSASAQEAAAVAAAVPGAAAAKDLNGASHLKDIIATGWPILSVLLVMSILSITIMVERMIVVRRAEQEAYLFLPAVMSALKDGGKAGVVALCAKESHPLAKIMAGVAEEHGDREAMTRVAQREIQKRIGQLEARIPLLGTVASTAPFVGLLGTVVGIIRAFRSIAAHSGGGPEVVAAGISEALIATAFGLFVAIPAVIAYNHFSQRIQKFAVNVDINVSEIVDKLNKIK